MATYIKAEYSDATNMCDNFLSVKKEEMQKMSQKIKDLENQSANIFEGKVPRIIKRRLSLASESFMFIAKEIEKTLTNIKEANSYVINQFGDKFHTLDDNELNAITRTLTDLKIRLDGLSKTLYVYNNKSKELSETDEKTKISLKADYNEVKGNYDYVRKNVEEYKERLENIKRADSEKASSITDGSVNFKNLQENLYFK